MNVSFSGENLSDIEDKILEQADDIRERRRSTLRGEASGSSCADGATLTFRAYKGNHDVGRIVVDEATARQFRQELSDWLVGFQSGMAVLHGFRHGPEAPVAWHAPLRAAARIQDPEAALSAIAGTLVNLRCSAMKRGGQRAAGITEACDAIGAVMPPAEDHVPAAAAE